VYVVILFGTLELMKIILNRYTDYKVNLIKQQEKMYLEKVRLALKLSNTEMEELLNEWNGIEL
jgi:hypothetical protein